MQRLGYQHARTCIVTLSYSMLVYWALWIIVMSSAVLTNGTKVKHIWSDAFSTYLSASLASLRLSTGLNLNVFPPHAHSSNPVENYIRNSTRSCRKNIANLVGAVVQGKAPTKDDVPEWWLHGYEYGIQRANTSPNATLLRRVGEGVNPLMIMTGDKSARLDLSKAHAFDEQGYARVDFLEGPVLEYVASMSHNKLPTGVS